MMKKLMSVLAVLLLLIYIGYQVSSNLTEQIETIDALRVDVEDKLTVSGVFVRDCLPVSGDTGRTYEFLVKNGEKVAKDETIAVCFDSAADAERFREAAELESDVMYAEQAVKSIKSGDGGAALDTSIFENMKKIFLRMSDGDVWDADALYSDMTQSVIARDYPSDDVEGLESSVAEMKARLDGYKNVTAGAYKLKARQAGYFITAAETSPTLCSVDEMYELTPEDVESMAASPDSGAADGLIGYLISSFEWHFVCVLNSTEAAELESMGRAVLAFPYMTSERVSAAVESVSYFDDRAVVIFSCGYMGDDFLGGVAETADIIKRTYSGIRLPKEALHMNDEGKWGVYCLNGAVVAFKPVEWVYQGDSFYLAKQAESASKGLYLYDKIIVKGKNLEENMVIK